MGWFLVLPRRVFPFPPPFMTHASASSSLKMGQRPDPRGPVRSLRRTVLSKDQCGEVFVSSIGALPGTWGQGFLKPPKHHTPPKRSPKLTKLPLWGSQIVPQP